MQRFTSSRGTALLALALLAACDAPPTVSGPDLNDKPLDLRAAVEAMGFRGDMIQDFGGFVLVEGDIYFSKAQLRTAKRPSSNNPGGPRFQYRTTNLVGSPKIQQIVVSLAGVTGTVWETPARDALAQWNAISGSYVKMVEGSPADISIATTCTSSNVAAYASFPSGGNPGATVYANSCFGYSIGYSERLRNMVHELGHTIGFRHTNYTQMGETAGTDGAIQISGTPVSGGDNASVMNGGTALNTWAGFSSYDVTATSALYPLPAPSVTVSNVSGVPEVSWSALVGATSYDVVYNINLRQTIGGHVYVWNSNSSLWNTTGTSWLDSGSVYTGVSTCFTSYPDGSSEQETHSYRVTAHFPNGSQTTSVLSQAAQC